MGRLAPDNRPIAADILRGRSSSPQLCTTEEASFISKVASHQCSLWPARFSLSENRHPSEFCARNSNRPMETFHLAGPLRKKSGGGRSQIPRDARVLLGEIPLMEVPRISLDP